MAPLNDEDPAAAPLLMDRRHELGNSEDSSGRRALHVKVMNPDAEPLGFVVSVPANSSQSESFAGAANGTTKDVSGTPLSKWSLQVTQVGGVSAWEVALEGSLDGVGWTTLLSHVTGDLSGKMVYSAGMQMPAKYYRITCVTKTGGASLTCLALGMA